MVACVGVVRRVEIGSALKGAVEGVIACNNQLNELKYFKMLVCRKALFSDLLNLAEKLVLLQRPNIVN
jgi:hypothetical protein